MNIALGLLLGIVAFATADWNKLMEGPYYQGDMRMSPEEISNLENNAYGATVASWPKVRGVVTIPYKIEYSATGARNAINRAINEYHARTCIRFEENSSLNSNVAGTSHIRFISGGGCSSPVGRQTGRDRWNGNLYGNAITLPRGCRSLGTVLHEIAHTLGFHHEQSRPDRGQHVRIIWGNIKKQNGQDVSYNFNIQRSIRSGNHPYDYESMMHYGQRAFGGGDITIRTINPRYQNVIGQRRGFSAGDVQQINDLYCR